MYYNYVYLDPRKNGKYSYDEICFLFEPFYVGKGKGNRYQSHINRSRIDNPIFKNKISKLIRTGINPYIEVFNHTELENLAYQNEIKLISQIGSDFISDIVDGPLLNLCLKNEPPNLFGKTYKEIYGDRWEEEIEKRRISIKENHRLYKRSHSEETKKKISDSTSKENNPRWGVKLTEETKSKISQKAKERIIINGSHSCRKWIVTNPSGDKIIISNGLRNFCRENNISYSTLRKCLKTKIPIMKGRTSGWNLEESI
jgi:hypothetical protein